MINTDLSHNIFIYLLLLRRVSGPVLGHLQADHGPFDVCSLYINLFGRSLHTVYD